jgi:hypothetical protein
MELRGGVEEKERVSKISKYITSVPIDNDMH